MKRGIIVASFGTTHKEAIVKSIEKLEKDIAQEFSDFKQVRAFTSRIVVNRLKSKYNYFVENEIEALANLKNQGIDDENIYIQPLHIIQGFEYEKLLALNVGKIGKPLLSEKSDLNFLAENLELDIEANEALIFFGHGSDHEAEESYSKLQDTYREKGINNIFFVNVEGSINIENSIDEILKLNPSKVVIQPFMIVAGDHAKNDMASDKKDSLKSFLESHHLNVETRLIGLGELDSISELFRKHLNNIIEVN